MYFVASFSHDQNEDCSNFKDLFALFSDSDVNGFTLTAEASYIRGKSIELCMLKVTNNVLTVNVSTFLQLENIQQYLKNSTSASVQFKSNFCNLWS